MRKAAWRRWAAVSGATLALAAFATATSFSAESTRGSAGGERAWLGVYTQTLTPELREGMNYRGPGVLVNRVVGDSPADRAGVRKGDVITGVNSRTVDSPEALADIVGRGRSGQSISLRVMRDNLVRNFTATLAGRSEDDGTDEMGGGSPDIHIDGPDSDLPHGMDLNLPRVMRWMGRGRLGVRIETLSPDLAGYFNVPDGKGVLVIEVMKDTPAEKAGVKAGDVITRVGDHPVADAEDLTRELGNEEGRVSLGIIRKGARRTIDAEIEKQERVVRIRRGDGSMRLNDDRGMRDGMISQRDLDELRRQIEELRRQVERLQKK